MSSNERAQNARKWLLALNWKVQVFKTRLIEWNKYLSYTETKCANYWSRTFYGFTEQEYL